MAFEDACLANFDRFQRFLVLGRFINRDAFLPRRHRALFLSAIGLMLLGPLVLMAGFGYFFDSLNDRSLPNNILVLLCSITLCGIMCAIPPLAFPFRKWNGNAALPAEYGDRWQLRRVVAMLPAICLAFLLFFLLHMTGLRPFAGSAVVVVVPFALAILYVVALWRTPKFVDPGFEERWIEEKMGRQPRRSG